MTFETKIDIAQLLTPLDWAVFAIVFAATLGAVVCGHIRKARTLKHGDEQAHFLDLLVMGRRLTLPLFVATLVATWYGGIFGVTEIAFDYGIYNFITQGVFWYVAYLIFAFALISRISRYKAVTLPDLVSKMFGPYRVVVRDS